MRKSSVPMAEPTMADPANAVEAAALLVEAVDAGKAVEAMRIVFSATAGWRRKQLARGRHLSPGCRARRALCAPGGLEAGLPFLHNLLAGDSESCT